MKGATTKKIRGLRRKLRVHIGHGLRTVLFETKENKVDLSLVEEDNLWKPMMMLDDYIAKSKLSESLTSTVWLAKHKLTGEEAVMKCFDLSKLNRNLRDCLNNELEFLSSVDHPNIIRLLHVSQDDDFLVMVLEYCDGGTLSSYIQRYGRVEEDIAKRFMKQIGIYCYIGE
jgi:serine/threonine protein kinase